MAEAVGAIKSDSDGSLISTPILTAAIASEKYFCFRFLELILDAAKDDEVFHQIFCSQNMSYDIIYRQIQIENKAFQFKYSNFKHILLNFGFLQAHPDTNIRKFIIHHRYRKLFDSKVMPEIKKRKIGIEELKRLLAQKEIKGKEGEAFALKFEHNRLASHPLIKNVEIISEYYSNAGYDIVSYSGSESKDHDRFIEVKSYQGKIGFHWTRNEMDVARVKKHQYFLYLVDRDQVNNEGYVPLIIQNPCQQVLENPNWEKTVEEYFITKAD